MRNCLSGTDSATICKMTWDAVCMLKGMIEIPSVTFEESDVAGYLQNHLGRYTEYGENSDSGTHIIFEVLRFGNNIAAVPLDYDKNAPTLLLNAHCDTVKPAVSYTLPPFEAIEKDGAIYGLGSNDDGGSVVALTHVFLHFCKKREELKESTPLNIVLLVSAEEERSGKNGISLALKELSNIGIKPDFAIIGEPTGMKAAVAERGLLVIDGTSEGVSGHAARSEGVNAIYKALEDIEILRNFKFNKKSELMGDVKLSVTQINAGSAHNVIPDKCTFVVDIRPTEQYTNKEILELLQAEVESTLTPRNLSNSSSATPQDHLLMKAVKETGIETFVSPTTSDWMKIGEIPAIKIGPGESSRSHKADEYIYIKEIESGISIYIKLIESILKSIEAYKR